MAPFVYPKFTDAILRGRLYFVSYFMVLRRSPQHIVVRCGILAITPCVARGKVVERG